MQYHKVKSVAKVVATRDASLEQKIAKTMKIIKDIVGGTLGPGGRPVLIERQEYGLPAFVTKDGVTVFRNLGFNDPISHVLMEAARDASVRTASEAGDGTTSASILAESVGRYTSEFCKANPKVSPQRVVRRLEEVFQNEIEPFLNMIAIEAQLDTDNGHSLLHSVATISANGDTKLADAVMECYDIVGDEGNVTILEINGPSKYEVEQIKGYAISMGYEDSCGKYYQKFINDPGTQQCILPNPAFVVYHGKINDVQSCMLLLEQIGLAWQEQGFNHNVVLIATGFSESVLAQLAINFAEPHSINVFPLLVPQFPVLNGQLDFLLDICALTDATLLDQMNNPIEKADLTAVGVGPTSFECGRFRSNIVGHASEELVLKRVDTLKKRLANPESLLERRLVEERIGKITGGIAKLKVFGNSSGELREKRDRADDAVCAVRGTIKHGCLPGGGWALCALSNQLAKLHDPIIEQVLIPALMEPVKILYQNAGIDNWQQIIDKMLEGTESVEDLNEAVVYDVLRQEWVNAISGGVLDSLPAVLEAVRNSLSIASLLGTLSGVVVFARDSELERSEAIDTQQYLRDAGEIPVQTPEE